MTDDPKAQAKPLKKPLILSGQEIYDLIMGGIEPELLSGNLDSLSQQHEGETPQTKAERMQRYTNAFKEYKEQYEKYMEKLHTEVEEYKKAAMKYIETLTDKKEDSALEDLESAISTS
ncbi:hypothetical protein KJ652_05680 [Patescibacteria group bacterium]|nr:hypothetical protein [Patescibacteria group bacterium]MBU1124052.1 hypothetical protein [Patescibacteria group bacterium]MBU1911022.1 hypothetical protein [Patescibacteria group bacterium]